MSSVSSESEVIRDKGSDVRWDDETVRLGVEKGLDTPFGLVDFRGSCVAVRCPRSGSKRSLER